MVGILFTLVAGCSNTTAPGATTKANPGVTTVSAGAVPLTMWGWNAGSIEKIFAEYVKLSGAKVTLDYVTVQQAEAFQKLQTTISAGLDMPDLVPTEIGQRGTMMALDIWEDLSKAPYSFDKTLTFDYFMPLCQNSAGELVCLPWDISTAAMAYKKDLAKQYLGTDDPAALQAMLPTWDKFKEVGLQVKEKTGGKVFMFASLTNVKQIIDGQNPAPIVTAAGKLDMANSVNKVIAKVVEFRDAGIVDNVVESSPAYSASYVDKIHIFYPCASWSPNYQIAPNDPKGIDAWRLMVPPEGCFSWGGSGHMIPTAAKHKTEGFNFINWLLTKEGTVSQFQTVGFFIAGANAYKDPAFASLKSEFFGDQNLGQILFVDAMKNLKVRPVSVDDVAISDTWSLVVEALNSDHSLGYDKAVTMFQTELTNKVPALK